MPPSREGGALAGGVLAGLARTVAARRRAVPGVARAPALVVPTLAGPAASAASAAPTVATRLARVAPAQVPEAATAPLGAVLPRLASLRARRRARRARRGIGVLAVAPAAAPPVPRTGLPPSVAQGVAVLATPRARVAIPLEAQPVGVAVDGPGLEPGASAVRAVTVPAQGRVANGLLVVRGVVRRPGPTAAGAHWGGLSPDSRRKEG